MHEMSITMSMLDIIREHMERNGACRLRSVQIRVGELTAVEPESLRFCFEVCSQGTPLAGAALDIEEIPHTGKCRDCGSEFRIEGFVPHCPACGGSSADRVAGNELDIVSMEVD